MKNITTIIVMIAIALASSCKEDDLGTYEGEDNIYFSNAVFQHSLNSEYIDTTAISFAFEASSVMQKTVNIPVRTQGKITDYDRSYKVSVGGNTTATEGTHFMPIPNEQTFHAGKEIDTLRVTLNRTDDLTNTTLKIQLKLLPNDDFNTEMQEIEQGDKTVSCITYTISFNDILEKPSGWNTTYDYILGEYSRKKWTLVCQLMDWPLNKLDIASSPGMPTTGLAMIAGGKLKAYLLKMEAAGTPILEEDGTPMTSGRYA
ncbi:MAG: DUF4843 domain-containing protein [Bacteroidales bacterium]